MRRIAEGTSGRPDPPTQRDALKITIISCLRDDGGRALGPFTRGSDIAA
jgi:hypothetical protein